MSLFFQAEEGIRDFCRSRGLGDLFLQAEAGIRFAQESRGLGDVYKCQGHRLSQTLVTAISIAFPF